MNDDRPSKKVAIEDLLRIKRAERPPAEFWTRFERELRAKQLAAIVEKRPWWRSLPRGVLSMSRLQIPMGAAAILALTFLTVREYRTPATERSAPSISRSETVPLNSAPLFVSSASVSSVIAPVSASVELPEISLDEDDVVTAKISPGFSASRDESLEKISSETSPDLLATFSDRRGADSSLVASLSNGSGFESRALPARSSLTDPLSQVATPKSVRLRDRYLGGALPAAYSADSAAASPDHVVNKLRDRQLRPEEFSRFDARGNSLSIKL